MEKKYKNYEKLKEYFLNIRSDDVLTKSNDHSFIALEWVFTDLINRKIIEKAIINTLQKLIPFAEFEGVSGFEVIRNNDRLLFQAQVEALVPNSYGDGEKSKTFKINFTDDQSLIEEDYGKKIRTYSFYHSLLLLMIDHQ